MVGDGHFASDSPTLVTTTGVTRAARRGICPRAQHFVGAKLRSECYVIITQCQLSTDAINYE